MKGKSLYELNKLTGGSGNRDVRLITPPLMVRVRGHTFSSNPTRMAE